MEILQWTMNFPISKQIEFESFYNRVMKPTWAKFGATKCELLKIYKERADGKDILPQSKYVERLYLKGGLTGDEFF